MMKSKNRRLQVLLYVENLYSFNGGGQVVYETIIANNPEVDFHIFKNPFTTYSATPKNVKFWEVPKIFEPRTADWLHYSNTERGHRTRAENLAKAVANKHFDLIDAPDWDCSVAYLKESLATFGVSYDAIVLAMHGMISETVKHSWLFQGEEVPMIEYFEEQMIENVDCFYALSRSYAEDKIKGRGKPLIMIDPMGFVFSNNKPKRQRAAASPDFVNLVFLGRQERRKGPDIFINLVKWLTPQKPFNVKIVGKVEDISENQTSETVLREMARVRNLDIEIAAEIPRKQLKRRIFNQNTVIFVPSRFDSLNLVAIEALFNGCPTVIHQNAQVCAYLEENFPSIPFIKISKDALESIAEINYLIDNFKESRDHLVGAINKFAQSLDLNPSAGLYQKIASAVAR